MFCTVTVCGALVTVNELGVTTGVFHFATLPPTQAVLGGNTGSGCASVKAQFFPVATINVLFDAVVAVLIVTLPQLVAPMT